MTKRLRWMGLGMLTGAGGTVWAQRRLRRRVERYLPAQLRAGVASRVRAAGSDLRGALEEGRAAMTAREAELRSQLRPGPAPVEAPDQPERPERPDQPGRPGRPGEPENPPGGLGASASYTASEDPGAPDGDQERGRRRARRRSPVGPARLRVVNAGAGDLAPGAAR